MSKNKIHEYLLTLYKHYFALSPLCNISHAQRKIANATARRMLIRYIIVYRTFPQVKLIETFFREYFTYTTAFRIILGKILAVPERNPRLSTFYSQIFLAEEANRSENLPDIPSVPDITSSLSYLTPKKTSAMLRLMPDPVHLSTISRGCGCA